MKRTSVLFSVVFLALVFFMQYPRLSEAASISTPKSYELIKTSLLSGQTTGHFDTAELTYKQVGDLIHQVVSENPAIQYYEGASIRSDGQIQYKYSVSPGILRVHQKAMQAEADRVLQSIIQPGDTDMEQVKAIHDYLVMHVAYDYENLKNNSLPSDSYTAYGALVKKSAVCEGYTKAAQLLLDRLGIENRFVIGSAGGELHSWNAVKLDDTWYFMDITWDDPVPDKPGFIQYAYFLVTTEQLRTDHTWKEDEYPAATSTTYRYFHEFGQTISVGDTFYFSNKTDNDKLYKINKDGTNKQRVGNIRAPYFAIYGSTVYLSNYMDGGYLYKMKLDGSGLTRLNFSHSTAIQNDGNLLSYLNEKTGQRETFTLEKETQPIVPTGAMVAATKMWTVTFNTKIDPASITNQNIYVTSAEGKTIPVKLSIHPTDTTKLLVYPPNGNYERNQNYVLTIEKVKTPTGKIQRKRTTQPFYVK
ncbi:transglutaminase domain-containing protein [Sporosarcina sp. Te-1]|uniref:transglutaminase domain-containing protein n=1 Tax=Sporosarcina sp. Te-1 TaxID=2818390 RepID=UPI001A9E17B4|nr:transglutaminase domain-containing protein [Sporosarcina sp. Te-1]QTD41024.1 DUF5050 domain-containing protein [Sporosarcina sp. Te-1]